MRPVPPQAPSRRFRQGVTHLISATRSATSGLLGRIARWRSLLRIHPFDTSTEEGRSAERYRRVAWSTFASLVFRIVAQASSFITVPLVLWYLGQERFGMWLTMSSLVATLGPLDLGIGYGLLTILSDANGRDDKDLARRAISSSMAMHTIIAFTVSIVFAVTYFFVPWDRVFNVTSPQAVAEAGPLAAVLFVGFAVGLPLSIVVNVQLSYQSGYVSSAWRILGSIGSLIALLIMIRLQAGLPVLMIAMVWVGLLTSGLNVWFLFFRQRPWLRPRLKSIDPRLARTLLGTGSLFLILQLTGLLAYQLDNMVIAQIMGAEAVPQYAVPAKLFFLAPTIMWFVMTPLWPAYRESIARGDTGWAARTLRKSIKLAGALNIPYAIAMVILSPLILHFWVGDSIHADLVLLIGLGAWVVLNTLVAPYQMILNGAGIISFQAICAVFMATANVAMSIVLVQRIGVAGAIYGSVISQLIFIVLPQTWRVRKLLRELQPSDAAKVEAAEEAIELA